MIEFENAIGVATKNAESLIQNASNFELEGVLISDDGKLIEVALSYDINGRNSLDSAVGNQAKSTNAGLYQLAKIMMQRREHKVFLVDSKNGKFRGFKNLANG